MRHYKATELKAYLDSGEQPLLLDVREPWEFEICQIKGSQLLPMQNVPQKLEMLNPHQEIVLICHHGIRSRQIGYYLESVGFTQLINLMGGVNAWAKEVDLTMSTY
jgi:rhodanese-related sulfurtransferase